MNVIELWKMWLQVHLELTRSFVENHDGTYDAYIPKNVDSECAAVASKSGSALPTLKPLELRTYLKIGMLPSLNKIL